MDKAKRNRPPHLYRVIRKAERGPRFERDSFLLAECHVCFSRRHQILSRVGVYTRFLLPRDHPSTSIPYKNNHIYCSFHLFTATRCVVSIRTHFHVVYLGTIFSATTRISRYPCRTLNVANMCCTITLGVPLKLSAVRLAMLSAPSMPQKLAEPPRDWRSKRNTRHPGSGLWTLHHRNTSPQADTRPAYVVYSHVDSLCIHI